MPPALHRRAVAEELKQRTDAIFQGWEDARFAIERSQNDTLSRAAANHTIQQFKMGDLVWVWIPNVNVGNGRSPKLAPTWFGPFRVVTCRPNHVYKVISSARRARPITVTADRLKPFYARILRPTHPPTNTEAPVDTAANRTVDISDLPDTQYPADSASHDTATDVPANPAPDPAEGTGPDAFRDPTTGSRTIEEIDGARADRRSRALQYRVRWRGQTLREWVNATDLHGAETHIATYYRRQRERQQTELPTPTPPVLTPTAPTKPSRNRQPPARFRDDQQ